MVQKLNKKKKEKRNVKIKRAYEVSMKLLSKIDPLHLKGLMKF